MNYIYEYDIAGCCVIVIFALLLLIRKNFPSYTNKLYAVMLSTSFFATCMDLVTIYTIAHSTQVPLWLNYISNMLYLASSNSCAILYYIYILALTKENRTTFFDRLVGGAVATIDALMIFTTPLTKLVFYFDEEFKYCHGPLMHGLYVTAVFMLFYCFITCIKHRRQLTKFQIVSIAVFNLSLIAAIILQAIFPNLLLQCFASSLFLAVVYVFVQIFVLLQG